MGRWSRHPMGSDGALDAKDVFMDDLTVTDDQGNTRYYFEMEPKDVKEYLLSLSLGQLEEMASREYVNENRFVIPYTFIEFEAYPSDPEIKQFLLECLDYTEDFEQYGNGEEDRHVQIFKDNFEDVISGKKILEADGGLFAAFADELDSGNSGLINKTKDN